MNTIPNLDAMPADELMSFWHKHSCGRSRKLSEELIGDRRKGFTVIAGDLAAYASNKATAMRCRVSGDISAALLYEGIADRIYERLPTDLRW